MNRGVKLGVGVLGLLTATALVAPMFIPVDYVKAQLISQVKKATGRELKIDGAISLHMLPNISIAVEKVTLGNPAGFTTPYFLQVGKMQVGAALMPLLSRQLEVTGITIDDASVHLEENAAGAKNWNFANNSAAKKPAEKIGSASSDAVKPQLKIGDIHLNHSVLTYRVGNRSPIEVRDVTLTVSGADGQSPLTLDLRNASLLGGTAKADVTRNLDSHIAANVKLQGIQIEPLMVAISGESKLQGATDLTLDVTTSGTTPDVMTAGLNGTGNFSVADGALKGYNIGQILREAQKGFVVSNNETRKTDFSELKASFTIANGVVSNEDLTMKSPALRVAGAGTISVPAKTINYKLTPTIVGTFKGQGGRDDATGVAVPLLITGPWNAPKITPDVGGLLEEGLKNPAAMQEKVKAISEQFKQVNSPKDIGKALFGDPATGGGLLGGTKQ